MINNSNNMLNMAMQMLGGNAQGLMQNLLQGKLNNSPLMAQFNKMMTGKAPNEQLQTIINSAQSMGININEKVFTKQQLANLGIKLP